MNNNLVNPYSIQNSNVNTLTTIDGQGEINDLTKTNQSNTTTSTTNNQNYSSYLGGYGNNVNMNNNMYDMGTNNYSGYDNTQYYIDQNQIPNYSSYGMMDVSKMSQEDYLAYLKSLMECKDGQGVTFQKSETTTNIDNSTNIQNNQNPDKN